MDINNADIDAISNGIDGETPAGNPESISDPIREMMSVLPKLKTSLDDAIRSPEYIDDILTDLITSVTILVDKVDILMDYVRGGNPEVQSEFRPDPRAEI
jgi:hypothetical protein